ncbi:hypothetical protein FHR84_000490 [Actinopolyspora biskrensis]|uniref:Uncharacterized protein n=1 Tax=Actinopolyspora biskrensis TaxID=1470178 RepID=A0A852Z0J0_9ACTN|nr:hypothetical protein [Actinopolyspora biskrensis]NYH77176.1 hypothetical protein [Actinopolyspora biskrensis]
MDVKQTGVISVTGQDGSFADEEPIRTVMLGGSYPAHRCGRLLANGLHQNLPDKKGRTAHCSPEHGAPSLRTAFPVSSK